jgi:hypothetical protein
MILASAMDSGIGPFKENTLEAIYPQAEENEQLLISPRDAFDLMDYSVIGETPLNAAPYTLKRGFTFRDTRDGEVFELKAGDVLSAYRGPK